MLGATSCRNVVQEQEGQNNSLKYPQEIKIGNKVEGALHPLKDVDFYFLQIKKPSLIWGSLTGMRGINHQFSFYNKNGRILKVDGAPAQATEKVAPFLVVGGLFVKIERSAADEKEDYPESKYVLELNSLTVEDEKYEVEANNNFRQATTLGIKKNQIEEDGYYSSSISGYHNYQVQTNKGTPEYDFFVLENKSKNFYVVDVNLSPGEGMDPVLDLYQAKKQSKKEKKQSKPRFLKIINNSGMNEIESLTGLGIKPRQKYYLAVYENRGRSGDEANYTLNYTVKKWQSDTEIEPNNSKKEALKIVGHSMSGTFENNSDEDYYKICLGEVPDPIQKNQDEEQSPAAVDAQRKCLPKKEESNNALSIRFSSPEKFAAELQVFSGKSSFKIVKGENEVFVWLPFVKTKKKYFFVGLGLKQDWAQSNNSDGNTSIPYKLNITARTLREDWEIEPNNKRKKASVAVSDKSISGSIGYKSDVDFFNVLDWDVGANQKLKISGVEGIVLRVGLLDGAGKPLKEQISSAKGKDIEFITTNDVAYIKVNANEYSFGSGPNQYTVTLVE